MTRHNSGGMGIMNTLFTVLLLISKSILGETVYELESTYIGGRVQDGVMFDVQTIETPPDGGTANTNTASGTTTPNGITIHGLNILTPLTTSFCVELYTKAGSFSAAAADESKWTYLGSFNIEGQGPNTPSTIPMGSFDPINVGMGETQAFYVTSLDEKLRYTALEDQPDDNRVTGEVYVTSESHVLDGSSSSGGTTDSGTTTGAGSSNTVPQTEISTPVNRNGGGVVESGESSGTISKGTGKERTSIMIEHEHGSRSRHSHHGHSHHHHHEHDRNLMKAQDVDVTQDTNKRILQTTNSGDGLSLQILVGVAKNYPFAESWPNRVFNGALMYTLGTDTSPDLTQAQAKEAFQTKRGDVKCDAPAMSLGSLSVAPTAERVPSSSPTKAPTPIPTVNPTKSPTVSPTTLESTIKKVATTLHGGLKQSGMMFDLKVPTVANGGPAEGVTVMAFETSTFLTDNICFEVYTKSGTYEGFENDVTQAADGTLSSDSWTVLGASTVTGQGEKAPTILPIGDLDPVYVAPGSTQAFYVTMTVTEQRYTQPKFGEKSGSVFGSDPQNYLELLVGSAVAYPFGETWKDRIYNGAAVFALGDVPDGRYNSMTAADRERSCPAVTTNAPTKSPTKAPIVPDKEIPTSESGTTPSPPTTPTTSSPSFGMTSVPEETGPVGEISTETSSRLADVCPELVVTPDDMVTENVVVSYSYTFYADSTADASLIATEMEDMLHRSLIESMCPAPPPSASRMLQEAIQYKGFRSGLTDTIDSQGCDATVTVPEGQSCYLVSGGVTAVVPRDTDAELVAADVGNFSKKTFSNPTNYEQFGVTGVEYIPIAFDPTATDNPYATDQYPNVDGAQESDQDTDKSGSNDDKKLSTTGIIIVSVLAGVLAIVILGFVAMRIHKKRSAKSADDSEMFQEFPDEEERYGIAGSSNPYGIDAASSSSGYNESIAPLSKWGGKSSLPPPPDERPPAMILNEADDISLFSSDKSRSRFAPSSMMVPPDSPGSRGSNNSKKSVEFIKAGHSFGATSNVPEDTVDL